MVPSAAEEYWQAFLATVPPGSPARRASYSVTSFGDNPELADRLAALIVNGVKTATCSCLWEWEAEQLPPPSPGEWTVVLDGAGRPCCIIETTEVAIRAFAEVDADFAAAEGEGDRTLEHWRQGHWRYFERALGKIGRAPSLAMPLVCVRFRRVYPSAD